MKTRNWIFITILFCFTSHAIYGQYLNFTYDGIVREYAVYEPSLAPNPDGYPLVVGLHGAGSDGLGFIATAGLVLKANAEKFIVASPSGLVYNFISWWNAGDGYEDITNGTDDLGFISALIDTMIANYNVDTTRIYLMAHSNGSMMAYRVAAEHSHKVAAIATNTGQMVYEYCDPEYPVPIIHFHGLEDPICPYEGTGDSLVTVPPVDSVMAIWRENNDCTDTPDILLDEDGILGRSWASSDGKGDIHLYTIEGWGHKWPRPDSAGIHATNVMWDFLKLQQKETVSNTYEAASSASLFSLQSIDPNPFNPSTLIKYTLKESGHISLKIFSSSGKEIETLVSEFQPAGEYEIVWQPENLPGGIYFCKLQMEGHSETKKMILLH